MRHESKCRHLHGHRYTVELTASAKQLDDLGRVIDFGVLKTIVGGWIDDFWDHGTIVHYDDVELIKVCSDNNWRHYKLENNPTAENLAEELFIEANHLLEEYPILITHIRLYETPNCWADYGEVINDG